MSKHLENSTDPQNDFVYTLSKSEVQMFADHFLKRELTPDEVEYFEIRLDKHLCTEFVVSAIEDCLMEITVPVE